MSRIGNLPIKIVSGVTITFNEADHVVTVKGPKGELTEKIDPDFKIVQENGELKVERPTDQKRHKSMHGLYRSLISNMVEGVTNGYKKELELVGVGYKAAAQGNVLELNIGFSHSIFFSCAQGTETSGDHRKRIKSNNHS